MSAVPQLNITWPTLSHFTKKPLGRLTSKKQPGEESGWGSQHKPYGLWVSVDGPDDWEAWCKGESFGIGTMRYRIDLRDPGALLWINGEAELLAFTKTYDKPHAFSDGHRSRHGSYIDWPRLARDWPGIVIAPYVWSCRLRDGTSWYYGWDCASGCIWDRRMIASATLLSTGDSNG